MDQNIYFSMVSNLGFLVIIANLMSRITYIKNRIISKSRTLTEQLLLIAFFSTLSILATYAGFGINGAILNTRAVVVLLAGLIGGPITGITSAAIAGLHRWLFDIGGFTSFACGCATFMNGMLGSLFYRYFQAGKMNTPKLALFTVFAELGELAMVLFIAKPFSAAFDLVNQIAVPMVLMNGFGMIAFVGAFQHIFIEENSLADRRIRQAMQIAQECLPHFKKGLSAKKDIDTAVSLICKHSDYNGVAIADTTQILSCCGKLELQTLLPFITDCIQKKKSRLIAAPADCPELTHLLKNNYITAAPLLSSNMDTAIGCLILMDSKRWFRPKEELLLTESLASLFSTQLELSLIDYQKRLLQKAEFQRLQSQVNPHFLFNCLNTISFFCSEKPERAKELLLLLSKYYRYGTNQTDSFIPLSQELEQVRTYLQLEKARFDTKLTLTEEIEDRLPLQIRVPNLILQPIVENAIKYGVGEMGARQVSIRITEKDSVLFITISDCGFGFPQEILDGLEQDALSNEHVGLRNVHKRLKSIYGTQYGLQIDSSEKGSSVHIRIPLNKEELHETFTC